MVRLCDPTLPGKTTVMDGPGWHDGQEDENPTPPLAFREARPHRQPYRLVASRVTFSGGALPVVLPGDIPWLLPPYTYPP